MFRIKDILKEKGLTINELAKMLNIDRVTLSRQINSNPGPPTITTLQKIADVLHIHITDLFDKPLDPESRPAVIGFIKIDKDIHEVTSIEDLINLIDALRPR